MDAIRFHAGPKPFLPDPPPWTQPGYVLPSTTQPINASAATPAMFPLPPLGPDGAALRGAAASLPEITELVPNWTQFQGVTPNIVNWTTMA